MKRAILASAALIVVLVVAGMATFYFTEGTISYGLDVYVFQKIDNQWCTALDFYNQSSPRLPGTFLTIQLQNKGLFKGEFTIIISLTQATISNKTFPSSQLIDNNTIKLSYSLQSQEKISQPIYFSLPQNATEFVVSIEFQTNQQFIRSTETNWGGQTVFQYGELENNTLAPALIS